MDTNVSSLLSRYWWLILLRGVFAVLFGVFVFVSPGISLVTLVLLFGAYATIDGIGNVATAIGGRKGDETWWVLLLAGLAGIGVGILTFVTPAVTAIVLLFYVAIWAIATGLLQIVTAIRLRKAIEGETWMVLGGIASVIFGVLLIANPGGGALAVLWIIGVYATIFGATVVILALKARRFSKRVEKGLASA